VTRGNAVTLGTHATWFVSLLCGVACEAQIAREIRRWRCSRSVTSRTRTGEVDSGVMRSRLRCLVTRRALRHRSMVRCVARGAFPVDRQGDIRAVAVATCAAGGQMDLMTERELTGAHAPGGRQSH